MNRCPQIPTPRKIELTPPEKSWSGHYVTRKSTANQMANGIEEREGVIITFDAEGIVLNATSLIFSLEEGITSFRGKLAKCTTLLPSLLAISQRLQIQLLQSVKIQCLCTFTQTSFCSMKTTFKPSLGYLSYPSLF